MTSEPNLAHPANRARPAARRRVRRGSPRVRWALRLIAVGYVLGLVALPVFTVLRSTFGDGVQPVLEALSSPEFRSAARLTLVVAGCAVLANTVFGVLAGVIIARYRFPGRGLVNALIDLPLAISPIVVGVSLVLVFGTTGWFGERLADLGIQVIFSTPGMVLATIIVSLPLVVREVVPVLEEAGVEQELAAQSLGAAAWQRFLRITLPTMKWALAYGVVLSLARSLGEFGAVRVVSGSVQGESQTLTLLVNDSYQEFGRSAETMAFSAAFVLMAVAVVFIIVIAALRPRSDH